jgi:hypothetical protein
MFVYFGRANAHAEDRHECTKNDVDGQAIMHVSSRDSLRLSRYLGSRWMCSLNVTGLLELARVNQIRVASLKLEVTWYKSKNDVEK